MRPDGVGVGLMGEKKGRSQGVGCGAKAERACNRGGRVMWRKVRAGAEN